MNFVEFLDQYQKVPVREYPNKVPQLPAVSICVKAYQHAPFIGECLEGILMQETDYSFEVLLGEDGSTDGTREICIEYAQKYPEKIRLFLHHRENNIPIFDKPSSRFNFVYNLFSSRGQYIALCDGDDKWTDPKKLQKQVDFLRNNPGYSLTVGGFREYNMYSKDSKDIIRVPEGVRNDPMGYTFSLYEIRSKWLTKTSTALFKRDDEIIAQFANYKLGRDIHLFYHILKKEKGFYFTSSMCQYNIHSGGMHSMNQKHDNIHAAYHIYKELFNANKDEHTRKMYFIHTLSLFNYNLYHKNERYSIPRNLKVSWEALNQVKRPKDVISWVSAFLSREQKARLRRIFYP